MKQIGHQQTKRKMSLYGYFLSCILQESHQSSHSIYHTLLKTNKYNILKDTPRSNLPDG